MIAASRSRSPPPAPAVWAAHKLWMSQRDDRDRGKAHRDKLQAEAVFDLIAHHLPQERLDPVRHSALPKAIADLVDQALEKPKAPPKLAPDW